MNDKPVNINPGTMHNEQGIAEYDELLGLLKARRSIRLFKNDPIPEGMIEKIIETARWAPAAGNSQPWEFVIIQEKETIHKLADLYEYQVIEKRWMESIRDKRIRMFYSGPYPGLDDPQGINKAVEKVKGRTSFRKAPCLILHLADGRWDEAFPIRTKLEKSQQHIITSMANAVLTMHLAAASLGLGTQWVSDFGSPWLSGMAKDLLNIPQHYMIYDAMPVGFPDHRPGPRYV
ncbi:MAG: nitroreductase family protein, partial [Deltaproteobacteria bacterium]|nr:nitroreductase family protein [Deltaproteobacteria bacterium]